MGILIKGLVSILPTIQKWSQLIGGWCVHTPSNKRYWNQDPNNLWRYRLAHPSVDICPVWAPPYFPLVSLCFSYRSHGVILTPRECPRRSDTLAVLTKVTLSFIILLTLYKSLIICVSQIHTRYEIIAL